MQTIKVRTTQNVFIEYPIASVGDRILATIIDNVVLIGAGIVIFVTIAFTVGNNGNNDAFTTSLFIFGGLYVLFYLLYHLLFEIFMDGQSPGKRAMKIKVIRLDGTPPTIGNYVIRWLLRIIDISFYGIVAIITISAGGKGQRLGDMAAGTAVVKLTPQKEVTASEVFTMVEDNYTPVFTQVTQLSEADIEVIQQALAINRNTGNMEPVIAVAEKIQTLLAIETQMPSTKFLQTVIRDYTYLSNKSHA